MKYPFTKKVDVVDDYHGTKVADPYRWLEETNSPEVGSWLSEQVALTENYFAGIPWREQIRRLLTEVYDFERYVPAGDVNKFGNLLFFNKSSNLDQHPKLIVEDSSEGNEEVLVDPCDYANGYSYANIRDISNDGKFCVFSISANGSDYSELMILDLETRKVLPEIIGWTSRNAEFHKEGFFYNCFSKPADGMEVSGECKHWAIKYHKIGTDVGQDVIIFDDNNVLPDPASVDSKISFIHCKVIDDKYLMVLPLQVGWSVYLKNLDDPKSTFTRIHSPDIDLGYAGKLSDKMVFQHNNRIIVIDPASPEKENWLIINDDQKLLLYFASVAGNKIFAQVIKDGSIVLHQFDENGKLERVIEDELNSFFYVMDSKIGKTDDRQIMLMRESFTLPFEFLLLNVDSGEFTSIKKVKPGVDFPEVLTKKVTYKSKDGTVVPLTIYHKPGIKLDGKNPTLLHGYGGYGFITIPAFSARINTFIKLGGIYAEAGVRGGGEFGEDWHKAGSKSNIQNSIDDFIWAGQYLIEEGYCDVRHLAINGSSHGGTLMGACLNQRPDLYAAVIGSLGSYDLLRSHKFSMGKAFIRENGSSENYEDFKWLYRISPLHNVKPQAKYPATLIVTNGNDTRCPPIHSFKFLCALQDAQSCENPILLKYHSQGGHGPKALADVIDESTDVLSFIFKNTGFEPNV